MCAEMRRHPFRRVTCCCCCCCHFGSREEGSEDPSRVAMDLILCRAFLYLLLAFHGLAATFSVIVGGGSVWTVVSRFVASFSPWNEIVEIGGFLLRWKFLTLLTLWLAEHVVAWAAWPSVHAVSNVKFFRSTFVKFQDLKRQHEQLLEGFRRVELMMRKKPSQTRSVASSRKENPGICIK